jgi:hypothetical protein
VLHFCPPFLIVNIHFYLSVFVTVSMFVAGFSPLNAKRWQYGMKRFASDSLSIRDEA